MSSPRSWEAKIECVIKNDAANALLDYEYRKPWTVAKDSTASQRKATAGKKSEHWSVFVRLLMKEHRR